MLSRAYTSSLSAIKTLGLRPFSYTKNDDIFSEADDVVVTHPSETTHIEYDGVYSKTPDILEGVEGDRDTPERAVSLFTESRLVGSTPVVRSGGRYILPASVGTKNHHGSRDRREIGRSLGLVEAIRGTALRDKADETVDEGFLLHGSRRLGVGNWFDETLSKLRVLEEYRNISGSSPELIVPDRLTRYQEQSLSVLGYEADSCVRYSGGPVRVNRLLVPSHRFRSAGAEFCPSPSDMNWLRNRFLRAVRPSGEVYEDRIYLLREDTDRRRVVNEDKVVDCLRSFGFGAYEPGRLSVEEQVEMFSGADIVVAPHGAGLVGMLFMQDSMVVEMLADSLNYHYFIMANELGLGYDCVPCKPVPNGRKARYHDIYVDTGRLREVVGSYVS
jgi:hypothetical protein